MSLKIALVGYGKMGQAVEAEAQARGHEVILRADLAQFHQATMLAPDTCDCIIEFTRPESAVANYRTLLSTGVPIVTGTTGWGDHMEALRADVLAADTAFLHSSNFSIGVNVLFKINQMLARLMNAHPEYDCYIEEAHHRHKKDAPSGTAMSLAEQILGQLDRKSKVADADLRHRSPHMDELSVAYTRAGEIIGAHTVSYISDIDQLTIAHQAFSRRGFALGAVVAAEWIQGRRGFFDFAEAFEG